MISNSFFGIQMTIYNKVMAMEMESSEQQHQIYFRHKKIDLIFIIIQLLSMLTKLGCRLAPVTYKIKLLNVF